MTGAPVARAGGPGAVELGVPADPRAAGGGAGGLAPGGRVRARRAGGVAGRVGAGAGRHAAPTHRAQARPLSAARAARARRQGEQ